MKLYVVGYDAANTLQKCTQRALEAQINEVSSLQEASLSSEAINTEVGTSALYLLVVAVLNT